MFHITNEIRALIKARNKIHWKISKQPSAYVNLEIHKLPKWLEQRSQTIIINQPNNLDISNEFNYCSANVGFNLASRISPSARNFQTYLDNHAMENLIQIPVTCSFHYKWSESYCPRFWWNFVESNRNYRHCSQFISSFQLSL